MAFTISGDTATPQPQTQRVISRPVVGITIGGSPILHGYEELEVGYRNLPYADKQKIESLYGGATPNVTITYDDPPGGQKTRTAVMMPPDYGQLQQVVYTGVKLVFIKLQGTA